MSSFRTLFLFAALLLTGCGGDTAIDATSEGGSPVTGGTATISIVSDLDALTQFSSSSADAGQVLRFMLFTPLVRLNENMEYEPYLAESMELSEDGLTLTFELRRDAKWHDGQPVTADDVVWSVAAYMDPALAFPNTQFFQFIDSVDKIDDYTVVFHFSAAHSEPLADFLDWQPMPRHLLGDVPLGEMRTAAFNRQPVGNGPFRFVSWTANQQLVFEANEDFFLGRPNLDRVVMRVIPDQTAELTELLTGRLDFARAIKPSEAVRVAESDNARLVTYPSRSFVYLAWNLKNPLFEDVRVRRALTMGIDRQEIVDALLYGFGSVAVSDVMPFQWQFDTSLESLPHDSEAALELLAEAGWTDSDGDGVLDKDGRPFSFQLETNIGNDLREDIIVIVQSSLSEIGVVAEPRLAEFNALIDRLETKDFEAVVQGWSVDFKFDPSEVLGCNAGTYNFPSYCSPEADDLVQRALVMLDQEEARPLWERYQEIIVRDQPYTFLYYLDERIGISNRLRGVTADPRGHLVSIADWWIPESQQ